jgi:N-methylhydantoinase A
MTHEGLQAMSTWQVGIDVGGTNTDLLLMDTGSGEFTVAKVPTTPSDQSIGVLDGLREGGQTLSELAAIVHGTTIATNAVLERKGARVGLITTRGFRDVLELGRRTRPTNYGLLGTFEALIDREFRVEISERLDARGRVVTPLDEDELRDGLAHLIASGAEAVVIHFLHSYANPVHEERAFEIAREVWPNDYITVSAQVLREVREFERGSTAAVNAYVQPVLSRYLGALSTRLRDGHFPHPLMIMQGNGGTMSAEVAARQPVQTVMSGPAAGAIAAARIGQQSGYANLIACDMGGTSFDVSVILGGKPAVSAEKDIAYGVPVRVPMVDIHTIGAGGGSIARVDAGGILRVGPESAGADPGPVCYGRGGTQPTVTDANLMLGRVDPGGFAGLSSTGGLDAVREALGREIGVPLGMDAEQAASAILAVAVNQLASAIRLVSIEKGHDPRDFALFAFGGAGPLHAVTLARELSIPTVLVPRFPGITSALGCVLADLRHDYVHTVLRPLAQVQGQDADAIFAGQAAQGRETLKQERVPVDQVDVVHEADLLYRGQSHVFRVSVESPGFDAEDVAAALSERYRERFEIVLEDMTPVLANLRTTVIGRRPDPDLARFGAHSAEAAGPDRRRAAYFDSGNMDTPVWRREQLSPDSVVDGPAIIEQSDTTVVIDPGARARVDALGNLIINVD